MGKFQLTVNIEVRNWKFSSQGSQYDQSAASAVDATAGVTKALEDTSLEEGVGNDSAPNDEASKPEDKKDDTKKTVVEEPSASSILDAFDF